MLGENKEKATGRLPKRCSLKGGIGIHKATKWERTPKFKGKFKMIALRMNLSLSEAETQEGITGVGMNEWPVRRPRRPEEPHQPGLPADSFFYLLLPSSRPSSAQTAWSGIPFIFTMNVLLFGRQSKSRNGIRLSLCLFYSHFKELIFSKSTIMVHHSRTR